MPTHGENTLEPEQFLHEALGFIAFIVPTLLIIVAVVIALVIAGFIVFACMLGHEARQNRKRDARIKAERVKRDELRIAARNRANTRRSL